MNFSFLRETPFSVRNGICPLAEDARTTFLKEIEKLAWEADVELALPVGADKGICGIPFRHASILADGSLFPCCGDFEPAGVVRHDFNGIFNHPLLASIRGSLLAHGGMPACRGCFESF